MNEEILSSVFSGYAQNIARTNDISSHIDAIIKEFLSSPFGENLNNSDGFSDSIQNRQISTLRTVAPDDYGTTSDIVIQIFSEGRAVTTAAWYQPDQTLGSREEKTIYFTPHESSSSVASRVIAAVVDFNDNSLSDMFMKFMRSQQKAQQEPSPPPMP